MARGRRVLVVDDEDSLRLTLAANLELEGFEVLEAGTAEEALSQLSRGTFDLIVTDIRMPGMNGVELFRRVHEEYPTLPVLLMTAFAQEELVEGALSEGAWTVLNKPFDVNHAIGVISRAAACPGVLVVDDKVVAEQTVEVLRARGVSASSVSGVGEAVERLQAHPIDVCVLESGLEGPALFERLRAVTPGIKAIVLSGRDAPSVVQVLAKMGVFAFFKKPVSPPELVRSIARARAAKA